jgi:cell wall-associated NlpC family hydrolase
MAVFDRLDKADGVKGGIMVADDFANYIANAIEWAKQRLGSTDYALRCLAFVEDAYEQSNHIEIFGGSSAQESADEYGAAQNLGTPPIGSFVFYGCSGLVNGELKDWGHVGLCIGDGQVIHVWSTVRIDGYLDVQNLEPAPTWTSPCYSGWAPIERVFSGYRKRSH